MTAIPGDPQQGIATVILSLAIIPEKTQEFKEYQNGLNERVRRFPGYASTEVFPPQAGVQDQWVVIYRFRGVDNLKAWLDSTERHELSDKIDGLLENEASVQMLVEREKVNAVTAVFTHRVKPGCEEAFGKWRKRIIEYQSHLDWILGSETYEPYGEISPDYVDVVRFADAEALNRWLKSPERKRFMDELEPLLDDLKVQQVNAGLDAWFTRGNERKDDGAPPSWKQAMTVWFVLYPTVMLLSYYFNPLFGDISLSLMMLISNAASVALLTWALMTPVNKMLGFWLMPAKPSITRDVGVAVGLFAGLIAMYFLFAAINPLK
ncbi:MAG: antibiotic biosynthesis monooxygenase [Verrucomicrobiota bacterium]